MKTATIQQIREAYSFHPYKDKFRITQNFGTGIGGARYGIFGHTGTDIGEENRSKGDNLYAPYDGKILRANSWAGINVGWQTYMETLPMSIGDVRFIIRFGYTHTRGKCPFKNGDAVKKGDVIDISGGKSSINSFWTGPHTHITSAPRYYNGDPNQANWQPDWYNSHAGNIDPMKLIINNKTSLMKLIKSESSTDIFLVTADNKTRILLVDMPTKGVLKQKHEIISEEEMAKYDDGGTMVWVDRIID